MSTGIRQTDLERPTSSFLSLLDAHEQLNEMFLLHQKALLKLDVKAALEQLADYEQKLRAHMRFEEEALLPIYRRAGPIPGGAIEFFTGEHKRMLEFIARFKEALAELEKGQLELERGIIELFRHQAMFIHLVEHHDLREQNILYPTLDSLTSARERAELLRRSRGWEESSRAGRAGVVSAGCARHNAGIGPQLFAGDQRRIEMPGPLEILKHEHRIIERGLRALDGISARLASGQPVRPEPLSQLLDFIRTFADRCHHRKEEEHLFPTLERHGIMRAGGPIGVMLEEHEAGRRLVAELSRALEAHLSGDHAAGRHLANAARRYIELLTEHIQKEDTILFRIAEDILDEAEKARLAEAFEQAEVELGTGTHEQFELLAAELEKELAV